ncbi:MAG: TerB family tellurite resistance protein [Rhodothermia bacterium]|nr:TerB family tellurite resistance protein [Rhodothermia bacterium]
MLNPSEDWSRSHDLALVYVALAYGTDSNLSDDELETTVQALCAWRPDLDEETMREVALEALAVFLDANSSDEVVAAIDRLRKSLSEEEREKALNDIVSIARADGIVIGRERTFISHVAGAWGVKRQAAALLQQASPDELRDDWNLLHDLGLLYIVLAHSSDNELSDSEIAAMVERLSQWQPELNESQIRDILRESLQFYSKGPGVEEIRKSVSSLKQALPYLQRVAVLDDMIYIAESDGVVSDSEQEIMSSLSQAFGVQVRLAGQHD